MILTSVLRRNPPTKHEFTHRNFLLVGEEAVENGHTMAQHRDLQTVLILHVLEEALQRHARIFQLQAVPSRPLPLLKTTTASTTPSEDKSVATYLIIFHPNPCINKYGAGMLNLL